MPLWPKQKLAEQESISYKVIDTPHSASHFITKSNVKVKVNVKKHHRSVTITLNVLKISPKSYQKLCFSTYSKYSLIFSCIMTSI